MLKNKTLWNFNKFKRNLVKWKKIWLIIQQVANQEAVKASNKFIQ